MFKKGEQGKIFVYDNDGFRLKEIIDKDNAVEALERWLENE